MEGIKLQLFQLEQYLGNFEIRFWVSFKIINTLSLVKIVKKQEKLVINIFEEIWNQMT